MENMIGFEGIGIAPFLMDRIAFSIGNFDVYWYAIIITVGLILAVGFCMWQAKRFDLTTDNVIDVLLWGLPIAVICARAYYVLFALDKYDTFAEMLNIRDGGLAIYGGVIGAFLTGFVFCKIKKVNMLALFDLASFGFLIGQTIGRWGNFVNAEAFGSVTDLPWGMTINGYGPYHPTFLYESLWNALGIALLFFFVKKLKKHHGEAFFLYFTWYGLGRFFIEGLRTDSLYLGSIRISQLLAAIFFVAGIVLFVLSRKGFIVKLQDKIIDRTVKKQEKYKPVYTSLFTPPADALSQGDAPEALGEGEVKSEEDNNNG
ncbi:MAG: prolipoprotein diacylglyceryl transferase [Clostridia bacterium]|nr:prolipoprotein diacylglyceryl transferase [Clostridia bacterium]MBQ1965827.1 prolipoprotein diacylglyceryl transferase [Clostridia bacterium]